MPGVGKRRLSYGRLERRLRRCSCNSNVLRNVKRVEAVLDFGSWHLDRPFGGVQSCGLADSNALYFQNHVRELRILFGHPIF